MLGSEVVRVIDSHTTYTINYKTEIWYKRVKHYKKNIYRYNLHK